REKHDCEYQGRQNDERYQHTSAAFGRNYHIQRVRHSGFQPLYSAWGPFSFGEFVPRFQKHARGARIMSHRATFLCAVLAVSTAWAQKSGPVAWQDDLTPIAASDWNYDFAAHLLERAGFGGTPEEIQTLAKMTPAQAVARLVRFEGTDASHLAPFDESGVH